MVQIPSCNSRSNYRSIQNKCVFDSLSDEITAISKLAEDSPLSTTLHSAGTTIAGPWNEVMDLIGQMHELLHNKHDVLRIQSDIRVGTRVDKSQTPADKIDVVKRKLKALSGTD
ncbi:UPF0045 protein M15 [Lodderomyces elongisporus]|uniref:UPF0045 protein M15 n=1 Tax=Lodderomyces elongisporus TaxID=36914 RepID=UPI0029251BC8|nr:UPF0045 protein M15 [Lodderomyces elongisporus]WLF79779.1 UPF0045 protein M15 [Lodderomyces elongisporus]